MKKYLEDFHRMKLFRLRDVVQIVGNERSAKDLLRNYKKQQLICQIRRDLYTVTDFVAFLVCVSYPFLGQSLIRLLN